MKVAFSLARRGLGNVWPNPAVGCIIVKNGRYGIYVTNGKVNVTLPKDNDYNTLDLDTAINMIKNKKPKKKYFKSK